MQEPEVWGPGTFAGYVHDHIAKTIGQLDTKVQILTGLTTGTLAFEMQCLNSLKSTATPALTLNGLELLRQPPFLLGAVAALTLMLALAFSLVSLWPRIGKSKESLIYFGGIAAHPSAEAYAKRSANTAEQDIVRAVFLDAYELASIARRKSWWAQEATTLFSLGLSALAVQLLASPYFGQQLF